MCICQPNVKWAGFNIVVAHLNCGYS